MIQDSRIRTIRSQVYHILRQEICDGRYRPGARLQEVALTKHLEVSRSPVREALRQLVADGLLVEIPNRGVFVREFTGKDIDDLFDLRLLLEPYAIMCSHPRVSADLMQQLYQFLDQMSLCFEKNDWAGYSSLDGQFHRLLVSLSGNSLLESAYERVASMNQQLRAVALAKPSRFQISQTEHREIIRHLAEGNLEKARDTIITHLEQSRLSAREQLEKRVSAT